ncbi:sortase (surface protein transpeptidase) [Actinoplanes octamycinicus]|uniref:Sortase (Surface protein transpeptidase) n=1 Tax=Actinoplanes octamycinicus TaxID=135948 RepID=A0A7W7GY81_9ACTN|nr:class F sortase [Actinoplanes octamycinicus]MBB4740500.1 sortase (surface protein transpeptidase) [Actinoplanes octamycinicus]GIE59760.1 class F sortase [Actinoplanes octamycinicus]
MRAPRLTIRDRRAAAFSVLLAVLGGSITAIGLRTDDALPPPVGAWESVPAPSPAATATAKKRRPQQHQLRPSAPDRLDIPAIGVHTPVSTIGLRGDGTLDVPPLRSDAPAGWYRGSPTPGEPGPAIIVGHVDTARDGPAVFFRLRELTTGDTFSVRRADRSVARFRVTKVASYPKKAFPSDEVYGDTSGPSLRLITCGGSFDRDRGSYRSNIVVFAALVP